MEIAYRFGSWVVEPERNRLSRGDVERHLQPLAMDVLVRLLAAPGQVITNHELLDRVWSDTHGEPGMVTKRISQIRRAVDDNPRQPTYIETIPKRGYRVIAEVSIIEDTEASPEPEDETSGTASPQATLPPLRGITVRVPTSGGRRVGLAALGLLVAVTVIPVVWLLAASGDPTPPGMNSAIRSIAILPFDNLSGDPDQEYVALGMTEELTTEMAQVPGFRVTSRTSVMRYTDVEQRAPEIAQELGVDGIIEGSVSRDGDRVRVTVQLIDARTDTHVWAKSFDRTGSGMLSLRTAVAREVANALGLTLNPADTVPRHVGLAAYEAYLRGLAARGPSELVHAWGDDAIGAFEQAVELAPAFSNGWAELATARLIAAVGGATSGFQAASDAAEQALSLDRESASGRAVRGYIRLLGDLDLAGAAAEFQSALESNTNHLLSLHGYADVLSLQQRYGEAVEVSDRIVALDPLQVGPRANRLHKFFDARRYQDVVDAAEDIRRLETDYSTWDEVIALQRLGRFADGYEALLRTYRRCGEPCGGAARAGEAGWNARGYEGVLRALIAGGHAPPGPTQGMFWLYAQVGEIDEAFDSLAGAVAAPVVAKVSAMHRADWDVLRLAPEFDALLDELGLPSRPADPGRTADVARIMAFRGRAPEAILLLNQALTASPDDLRRTRWLESMAWAHFANADYVRSLDRSEEVLSAESDRYTATFALLLSAASAAHLGHDEDAAEAVRQALHEWPSELDLERDVRPLFTGGDPGLHDRFFEGLRQSGLPLS